ncbi:MAG: DUF1540 domain-containing protein [Eubacteriales bacterium]|jgi:hypothetical protein
MDKQKDKGKVNKGIACSVTTCVYNDHSNHCTAEKIAVGPSSATCCADTVCATFRPRDIG